MSFRAESRNEYNQSAWFLEKTSSDVQSIKKPDEFIFLHASLEQLLPQAVQELLLIKQLLQKHVVKPRV